MTSGLFKSPALQVLVLFSCLIFPVSQALTVKALSASPAPLVFLSVFRLFSHFVPGYYCANGVNRTACPIGSYNVNTSSISVAACVSCPFGQCVLFCLCYVMLLC